MEAHAGPKGRIVRSLAAFLLGCVFVLLVQLMWNAGLVCDGTYDLLNPKFACNDTTLKGEWDYEPLRERLVGRKAELKEAGTLTHLSVYFRDLDNGPRFGIGEYDQFQPASLLKVPVMFAILHEADRNPGFLDERMTSGASFEVSQNIEQGDQTIQANTTYSIRELLRRMIVYSDNFSKELLAMKLNATPPPTVYRTFLDLDMLTEMRAPNADEVSIQSYGNLFAVLYNTGYLSKAMSQFALELLSQSMYKRGLVAGVPAGTRVAHKFGYRLLPGGENQLHDCGIVYHPSTTYVLCVMTSGLDLANEETAIAEISRIVYGEVSALR